MTTNDSTIPEAAPELTSIDFEYAQAKRILAEHITRMMSDFLSLKARLTDDRILGMSDPAWDFAMFEQWYQKCQVLADIVDKPGMMAAALGKRGGQSTSEAKQEAARENGKKGGRPKK